MINSELSNVLFTVNKSPVIIVSNDHKIVEINPAATALYQWAPIEVIGKNLQTLCEEKQLECPFSSEIIEQLQTSKGLSSITEIAIGKMKKITEWTIHSTDHTNPFYILIGNDITELKLAEDKIYELDSIIAQLPGNVYWYSKEFIYLGCNENSAKTFGMSRTETIGKNFREIMRRIKGINERTIDSFVVDGQQIIATGKPKSNIEEPPFIGSDGEYSYWLANKVPLSDRKGNIYGVAGISTDITDHKKLEHELSLAKVKSEMANHAKSQFIANMSHDLRTPLTGLLGAAQYIQKRSTDEKIREEAHSLIECTEALLKLFNEIIELIRIESGKVEQKETTFSLRTLINDTMILYQPTIRHKNLKLHVQISHEIPDWLIGNKVLLQRVLLNLVSNAIKFTKEGSISVYADPIKIDSVNKVVMMQIIIQDTGIGIPNDKIDEVFEHFARLTPSNQGIYEGSGLGLYTVKNYLGLMKGNIQVESEPGKGSKFIAQISMKIPDTTANIEPLPVSNTTELEPKMNSPMQQEHFSAEGEPIAHILVVEDHPLAAKMVANLLTELNCSVDVAETGRMAIAKAEKNSYDLAYLDIGLPDMDGMTVCKEIRKLSDPIKAQIPTIALTAHMTENQRQHCIEVGMQDMFTKPLTRVAAEAHIQKYVLSLKNLQDQQAMIHGVDIDFTIGTKLVNGDQALARELLELLLKILPDDFKDIQEAYSKQQWDKLYDAALRLYGSLCYCGVPKLQLTGKALTLAAHEQNLEQIEISYVAFCTAINEFVAAYEKMKA